MAVRKRKLFRRKERIRIIEKAGYRCHYCGKTFLHNHKWPETELEKFLTCLAFEIDHYIPFSKGGSDNEENLRVACNRCNSSKHNKMPWDFKPIEQLQG